MALFSTARPDQPLALHSTQQIVEPTGTATAVVSASR
jgi:hypothetical protein